LDTPTTTTITGLVATTPRHLTTQDGLEITSFRIASTSVKYNYQQGRYVDGETNWFTITAFRALALNASKSIHKGDRVIISGVIRVRDWDNGERAGTSVEIEASTIGHDLSWGTTTFERTVMVKEQLTPASIDFTADE